MNRAGCRSVCPPSVYLSVEGRGGGWGGMEETPKKTVEPSFDKGRVAYQCISCADQRCHCRNGDPPKHCAALYAELYPVLFAQLSCLGQDMLPSNSSCQKWHRKGGCARGGEYSNHSVLHVLSVSSTEGILEVAASMSYSGVVIYEREWKEKR